MYYYGYGNGCCNNFATPYYSNYGVNCGCANYGGFGGLGGCGTGWISIILVIFLILVICGFSRNTTTI